MNHRRPLVVFGCTHIGARTADLAMAKRYVDFVKRHDGYALLLADNHEVATPNKGAMVYEQDLTPQEQYEYGLSLMAPIAKNIVGACTGNHANRAYKVAGMDLDRCMAERLGYIDRYHAWQGFVSVKCGKVTYNVAFKHGNGVGSNTFGNCVQLSRAYPSADLCCCSHMHKNATTQEGFWVIKKGQRVQHPVTFLTTGSLLDYPRYADEAGYLPQPKGFSVAWLHTDKFQIDVEAPFRV